MREGPTLLHPKLVIAMVCNCLVVVVVYIRIVEWDKLAGGMYWMEKRLPWLMESPQVVIEAWIIEIIKIICENLITKVKNKYLHSNEKRSYSSGLINTEYSWDGFELNPSRLSSSTTLLGSVLHNYWQWSDRKLITLCELGDWRISQKMSDFVSYEVKWTLLIWILCS